MRDPKFWQGGFDVLEKLVSELEKLPVEGKAKPAAKKTAANKIAKGKKKSKK